MFLRILILSCMFLSLESCGQNNSTQRNSASTIRYDLSNPDIIDLPAELNEISGIIYSVKDKSLFAIQDENGVLYQVFLSKPVRIKKWEFAKPGDYEDLALVGNTFYVLQSNGNITGFNLSSPTATNQAKFPEKKGFEFESLYYDPSYKQLVMICKDCAGDKKKAVSAWGFSPSTKKYTPSLFTLKASSSSKKSNKDNVELKPSAAAFHPITHDLYILSSINKMLAVTSNNGAVKAVYTLDDKLFKQPEGIAFLPSGDMIISNEFNKTGNANLLIFKYK